MAYYRIEPSVSIGQLDNWTQLYSTAVRRRLMHDLHTQVEKLMGNGTRRAAPLKAMADTILREFLLTPRLPPLLGITGRFVVRLTDPLAIYVDLGGGGRAPGECEIDDEEKFLKMINSALAKHLPGRYRCGTLLGKGCKYDSQGRWRPRRSYALVNRYGRQSQLRIREGTKLSSYSFDIPLVVDVEWTCEFVRGSLPV